MNKYFGIDVSHWQGDINWEKVKPNIDFAILSMGYIGNNEIYIDPKFERNYHECKRLQIPVGAYTYSYVNTRERMKQCGEAIANRIKNLDLDLPFYIDMEENKIASLGKNTLTNMVIDFNNKIESVGKWAGVYANLNWYENYLNKNILRDLYTCWIAHYTTGSDKYKGQYDIWQNSSTGRIDGINGNVDTNYLYRDLFSEIKGTEKVEQTQRSTGNSGNNMIKSFQEFLNINYNAGLIVDGIFGTLTNKALIKMLQTELNKQFGAGLVVDGIFGNATYSACVVVSIGAKGNLTRLIQMCLYIKGYNIEIDSIFGNNTYNAILSFQRANGLINDGKVGKDTFKKLLS